MMMAGETLSFLKEALVDLILQRSKLLHSGAGHPVSLRHNSGCQASHAKTGSIRGVLTASCDKTTLHMTTSEVIPAQL
jgi:hypothetical protein